MKGEKYVARTRGPHLATPLPIASYRLLEDATKFELLAAPATQKYETQNQPKTHREMKSNKLLRSRWWRPRQKRLSSHTWVRQWNETAHTGQSWIAEAWLDYAPWGAIIHGELGAVVWRGRDGVASRGTPLHQYRRWTSNFFKKKYILKDNVSK